VEVLEVREIESSASIAIQGIEYLVYEFKAEFVQRWRESEDEFVVSDCPIAIAVEEARQLGEFSLVEENTDVAQQLRELIFQIDATAAVIVGNPEETTEALDTNGPTRLDFLADAREKAFEVGENAVGGHKSERLDSGKAVSGNGSFEQIIFVSEISSKGMWEKEFAISQNDHRIIHWTIPFDDAGQTPPLMLTTPNVDAE
jgi:hypothetical protein